MSEILFQTILISPAVWILLLTLVFLSNGRISEKILSEAVKYFSFYMLVITFALFVLTFKTSPHAMNLDYDDWIEVGEYRFKTRFLIDLIGATYALLSAALVGIIFKFSRNYLHKEEGYFRFIFLLSVLLQGLLIVCFSRSLDLLFAGWELVGTTSVLLIGYFYSNVQPVKHAVKAMISYRLCDTGILAASAWAHHNLHSTDFTVMPSLVGHAHSGPALTFIGLFVIWASIAKSGQLPMCSWLPTAMEGPTPSSAIFYGALSVHLGPFLLLRFHDYLAHFPVLLVLVGVIGGCSALYATLVGRTRSDAKTMLAYATITQVGIIWVEIALGFTGFALFHIVCHASLRTYQFLRSASLIQDFFDNPSVTKDQTIKRSLAIEKFFSQNVKRKFFIHALHGFHLDYFTMRLIQLILAPARAYMKMESKWMAWDDEFIKRLLRKKHL